MNAPVTIESASEKLAARALALTPQRIPAAVRARVEELLIDIVGLCVAARSADYMRSMLAAVDAGGACTAIGHAATFAPGTAIPAALGFWASSRLMSAAGTWPSIA